MLILFFFHSATATAVEMVILRAISSSSKSVIVLPSSTRRRRFVDPAVKSNPAVSDVFPESPWPTTPTFRMSLPSYVFTGLLLRYGILTRTHVPATGVKCARMAALPDLITVEQYRQLPEDR